MPKISIHLVTWNGEKYIEECLNSILAQTWQDFLLLIVDNGSVDKTVQIIEENFLPVFNSKIRLVKNKENLGFAKAHNQAILWTDSEYVVVLNQDVILDPNFLSEIIKFCATKERLGSVSGKVLRFEVEHDGVIKTSQKSDIIDSLGLKVFKNQRVTDIGSGEQDTKQFEQVAEIFGVSATCPVYSRKALEDVRFKDEFFDNDFFSYKEDVDLAYRLRWRNWDSFYLPSALAYHKRSAKSQDKASVSQTLHLRKNKNQFINYHSYKNHLFVLKKDLSTKIFLRYLPRIFFYELTKFFYLLFVERSTLSAWNEYFSRLKKIKEKRKVIMANRLVKDEELRRWFN